jgi:hypothetical protein
MLWPAKYPGRDDLAVQEDASFDRLGNFVLNEAFQLVLSAAVKNLLKATGVQGCQIFEHLKEKGNETAFRWTSQRISILGRNGQIHGNKAKASRQPIGRFEILEVAESTAGRTADGLRDCESGERLSRRCFWCGTVVYQEELCN